MSESTNTVSTKDDFQTAQRGTNDSEYQIYVDNAKGLGWEIKSYEDWLNS